jgi:ATP-binding cassette subfamily F protein 2
VEVKRLEEEAERLAECDPDDLDSQERLQEIYEQLDELNSDTREARAANILYGLGFTAFMQV